MYDKEEKRALQKLDIELYISAEADEMWSFVERKSQQRWLWYVLDRSTKRVLAFVFGARTDEVAKQLADLLPREFIDVLFTDDWGAYKRINFAPIHITGKANTLSIERKNLDLRTRIKRLARKTICFSKSIVVHDAVIGSFICNYMF